MCFKLYPKKFRNMHLISKTMHLKQLLWSGGTEARIVVTKINWWILLYVQNSGKVGSGSINAIILFSKYCFKLIKPNLVSYKNKKKIKKIIQKQFWDKLKKMQSFIYWFLFYLPQKKFSLLT